MARPVVIDSKIEPPAEPVTYHHTVHLVFSNGDSVDLVEFNPMDVFFFSDEFLGLTREECNDLVHSCSAVCDPLFV